MLGLSAVGPASLGRVLFLMPVVFVAGILLFILVQIIQGALFIATRAKLADTQITVGDACKLAADKAGRLVGISLLIVLRVIGYVLLFVLAFGILAGVIGVFGRLAHVAAGNPFNRGHLPSVGVIAFVLLFLVACHLRKQTRRQLIVAGGIRAQSEIDDLDAEHIDAVAGMAIYTGLMKA